MKTSTKELKIMISGFRPLTWSGAGRRQPQPAQTWILVTSEWTPGAVSPKTVSFWPYWELFVSSCGIGEVEVICTSGAWGQCVPLSLLWHPSSRVNTKTAKWEKNISALGWDSCRYLAGASNAKELWSGQGYSLPRVRDARYLTQKTLVQLCITGCGKTKLFITLSLLPKRKHAERVGRGAFFFSLLHRTLRIVKTWDQCVKGFQALYLLILTQCSYFQAKRYWNPWTFSFSPGETVPLYLIYLSVY